MSSYSVSLEKHIESLEKDLAEAQSQVKQCHDTLNTLSIQLQAQWSQGPAWHNPNDQTDIIKAYTLESRGIIYAIIHEHGNDRTCEITQWSFNRLFYIDHRFNTLQEAQKFCDNAFEETFKNLLKVF
jgi:hypothetical protein